MLTIKVTKKELQALADLADLVDRQYGLRAELFSHENRSAVTSAGYKLKSVAARNPKQFGEIKNDN